MNSKIKQLRQQHGYSQEQLAEMAGLSTRTIQRMEQGKRAGLESWKSLAAVFECSITELQEENLMTTTTNPAVLSAEENAALQSVRRLRRWYLSLFRYAIVIPILLLINIFTSPEYFWVIWVALGWGIGLTIKAILLFTPWHFFDDEWERRQVEKRLGRKL